MPRYGMLFASTVSLVVFLFDAGARVRANQGSTVARASDGRIEALLGPMTIEEKIDYIGGIDGFFIRGVPRLHIPSFRMSDGPFGLRGTIPSTTMAAGIALAATWDPGLAERVGVELGRDARARGVHFLLGPGVNIYRAAMNGRNFEYFGEDPLLAGRIAVGYINGVQRVGVSATIKHFAGNNSEFDRHHTNSEIDERALREIYLPAFEMAVRDAKVGAVMTSYNLLNGVHTSQLRSLTSDLLKREWRFDGVVMSDWNSVYDGIAAANSGLDVEMPSGARMNRDTLMAAVRDGRVTSATLDDKVRRVLRVADRFGWFDRPQVDPSVPLLNLAGRTAALEAATKGMVLLKNDAAVLPVNTSAIKTVAVIGPLAYPAVPVGGGSAGVQPFHAESILEAFVEALGPAVTVQYNRGLPTLAEIADRTAFTVDRAGSQSGVSVQLYDNTTLTGTPVLTRTDAHIALPGPFVPPIPGTGSRIESGARWVGYYTAADDSPHRLFVHDYRGEGGCRAAIDDATVIDNWRISKAILSEATVSFTPGPHKVMLECFRRRLPGSSPVSVRLGIVREAALVDPDAARLAARSDVVIAAVGFDNLTESESGDRTFALPLGQDLLLQQIAGANRRTIVTVTSGGGVDMTGWIERVPAVIMTWYAGEQGGRALANLVTGIANFSGRLPITLERRWEDNPNSTSYYPDAASATVTYSNGIYVGYRGYEHNRVAPLFPFGFGLSYTTFEYSGLTIGPAAASPGPAYIVSFDLTNTGSRDGADVAQVYVAPAHSVVPRPPKELKAFARLVLPKGERTRVSVVLDRRAFSYWDTASHAWRVDSGPFDILVGSSSAMTPLHVTVALQNGTVDRRVKE